MSVEEKYVDDTNSAHKVVVWSKSYCPYCKKVKELFKSLNVAIHVIELDKVDNGAKLQAALKSKTGQSSVPNVFINNTHVGGCDDTHAKHKDGSLETLLNQKVSEDELRHVFSSKDELSENVGKFILEKSLDAIEKNGRFNIAFSGGSLPKLVAKGLLADDVQKKIDWKLWHFFWSDERCVPLDDKDSNYRSLKELLLDRVDGIEQSNVHHIDPKLVSDPTKAAAAYEAMLKKEFGEEIPSIDLILLGMGPDGHTCSLFPGHKLLDEKVLLVAPITDSPKPPSNRITLTYPIVNASKLTAFVCTGSSKQEALSAIWGGGKELPSGRVSSAGGVHWFVDEAAVASVTEDEKKE